MAVDWKFDRAELAQADAVRAARHAVPFLRTQPEYEKPYFAVASAEDFAALQKRIAPVADAVLKLAREEASITANPDLTADGRQRQLQAVDARRTAAAAALMPSLFSAADDTATGLANLETAADLGATWDPATRGYRRPDATATDDADVREARAVWRGRFHAPDAPRLQDGRDLYRGFVVAGDPKARWMENDPTGMLVSDHDREWARNWRIEHSPLLGQIEALRAKRRTLALIIDSALRAFRVSEAAVR